MDRNRELLRRFEEQTLQMKEMNRELVDARSQLSMTATGIVLLILMLQHTVLFDKISNVAS